MKHSSHLIKRFHQSKISLMPTTSQEANGVTYLRHATKINEWATR